MEDKYNVSVEIPLDVFEEGVTAKTQVDAIKNILLSGGYACSSIFAILGIKEKKDAGAD